MQQIGNERCYESFCAIIFVIAACEIVYEFLKFSLVSVQISLWCVKILIMKLPEVLVHMGSFQDTCVNESSLYHTDSLEEFIEIQSTYRPVSQICLPKVVSCS